MIQKVFYFPQTFPIFQEAHDFFVNTKNKQQHNIFFTNKQLRTLLVPIMVEQLLSSLMGTADTMMVSNVGSAAISAVSLVDAINILVIQALSALAAGGAILCSQYLGSQNLKKGEAFRRAGAFRYARPFLFAVAFMPDLPFSAASSDFRHCRHGRYGKLPDLLFSSRFCRSHSSVYTMQVLPFCVHKTTPKVL